MKNSKPLCKLSLRRRQHELRGEMLSVPPGLEAAVHALHDLLGEGATVISNRDAANPVSPYGSFIWGTYKISGDQDLIPLAVPFWDWGKF